MEDTDLQWGWPKTEMAMVKAPGPFYKFSDPKKDSSKLIRRNKGRKKSMNLDSFVARSLLPNTPTFDRDDGIISFPNSIVNSIHLFRFVCSGNYIIPHDDFLLLIPSNSEHLTFLSLNLH